MLDRGIKALGRVLHSVMRLPPLLYGLFSLFLGVVELDDSGTLFVWRAGYAAGADHKVRTCDPPCPTPAALTDSTTHLSVFDPSAHAPLRTNLPKGPCTSASQRLP